MDCTHADLLEDLLRHTGRRRAKRLVFLAALGKLVDYGASQGGFALKSLKNPEFSRHIDGGSPNDGGRVDPAAFKSEDVEFLARLQDGLP